MRGTKAKSLRRKVYGSGMPREHRYARRDTGAIELVSDRQRYQALKRIIRYATL